VSWLAQESAMSFGIYAVGYLILIAGIAYLAHLMHVPERYIIAVAIILFGIGVVTGVQSTRNKDPN
jgi:membrane-bound acyltransferase YfiQ involved in biofilm formation